MISSGSGDDLVYLGSPQGLSAGAVWASATPREGPRTIAGDLNGDGFADLIRSFPNGIHLGSTAGLSAAASKVWPLARHDHGWAETLLGPMIPATVADLDSEGVRDNLGAVVADVNGDQLDELIAIASAGGGTCTDGDGDGRGVPQDLVQSYVWFDVASMFGHRKAKYRLETIRDRISSNLGAIDTEIQL